MREWLEWKRTAFTEYDIEADQEARERVRAFAEPPFNVPILVEDGKILQVGWQGRSCVLNTK
jgi:glutaredoxin 3